MNEAEQALADDMYAAIQRHSNYSDRSMQGRRFEVGISDLGFCSERTRRMLTQDDPDDTDVLAAFIGTAVGREVEDAYKAHRPTVLLQADVTCELRGDQGTYNISGHPDIIDPTGVVIDGKTTRGLEVVRRTGPSRQQQFQRHCYAKGAFDEGWFNDDVRLEDVRVANIWMDRAADDKGLHCQMENYNPEVVAEAADWLDEVVYAYLQGTEARKEPPREMCAKTCGFFDTCRLYDTDSEGLLTDNDVLTAVRMYREGVDLEKQGRRLKDQAKPVLTDISGVTTEWMVRWVWVNETVVPESKRAGYNRLDLRRVK